MPQPLCVLIKLLAKDAEVGDCVFVECNLAKKGPSGFDDSPSLSTRGRGAYHDTSSARFDGADELVIFVSDPFHLLSKLGSLAMLLAMRLASSRIASSAEITSFMVWFEI
jgi:hypothetical protein